MLGYLEQMPLYNAANFSWAVAGSGGAYIAFLTNSTSSLAIVNGFICPSDGVSPIAGYGTYKMWTGVTNNYFASLGTTTMYTGSPGNVPPTTGLFTQGGQAYGLQNITDGSSNTIAFGESLVGDNTIEQVKWRDGPVLLTASATGPKGLADVSTNYAATIADLQACAVAFAAQTQAKPGNVNLKGFRWGESEGGFALFNTIIPPTSTTYSFAWCRPGGGSNSTEASDGMYQGSSSNHPGGANFLFGDGSVHFLKSSISIPTYWALGTKSNGEIVSSDSY
jgi:prepilin-type processing-associated H-X9-DG protein